MNISACLLAFICLLHSPACSQVPPTPPPQPQAPNAAAKATEQKGRNENQRIAIPEIEGCTRDQTTFYQGKVLRFRRTSASAEITIRTDWDTTEKLVQAIKDHPIQYRLKGRALTESALRQMDSHVKNSVDVRATAWICRTDGSEIIKMIEWEPPRVESSR